MSTKIPKTRPSVQGGTDSTIQSKNRAPAATSDATTANASTLEKDYDLLSMIVRRNHNQHRNQLFFKDLTILRKTIRKLLTTQREISALQAEAFGSSDAARHRERFEKEAELRSRREYLTDHIRDVLVPRAFASTTGLMKDVQFAHLGLVVLGLLASVSKGHDGVGLAKKIVSVGRGERILAADNGMGRTVVSSRQLVTGDDMGEVVERHVLLCDGPEVKDSHSRDEEQPSTITGQPINLEGKMLTQSIRNGGADVVNEEECYEQSRIPGKEDKKEKRKSKKSKGKNAIDDLFDGLL